MAESDLKTLLKTLTVKRHDHIWRFETIAADASSWTDLINLREARSIAMMFMETEGPTIIVRAADDTPEDNRWVWLELSVYSDLQAVGFVARVAEALTRAQVPCNAVAAFHHDHVFVPEAKAEAAITALIALTKSV